MLKLKQLWSVFFLLVYSISFGHAIIPSHNHFNTDGTHPTTHCETETNEDHGHIAHDNHVDEGIVDFLGCLIENLHNNLPEEHHTCHETYTANQQSVNKVVYAQQLMISLSTFQLEPLVFIPALTPSYFSFHTHEGHSPLPQLRGPPVQ